jgi:hypothetical protein
MITLASQGQFLKRVEASGWRFVRCPDGDRSSKINPYFFI